MQRNPKSGAHRPRVAHDAAAAAANPALTGKTIVLVGLMGAGKTTVGRRLAQAMGRPFVDADNEIEIAGDMAIADMFELYGEAEFRDGERRVIARLLAGPAIVLATGGGAYIDAETRGLIGQKAISIWLDSDIEVLAERVSRRDIRPLLRGHDPAVRLRELAEVRNPIYAEADIHVTSNHAPHDRAVTTIIEELAAWKA